jgi:hypothetical protein
VIILIVESNMGGLFKDNLLNLLAVYDGEDDPEARLFHLQDMLDIVASEYDRVEVNIEPFRDNCRREYCYNEPYLKVL